ncbi:MAG: orotidine-5'-phosphate decarboxylase [Gammaproteobacteria bacterium]|nr:orotidine-5'-phosphate decarboxylase [Gammaproteobacteria bacterium]
MDRRGGPRLIVALDFAEADAALAFVRQLDPSQCRVKVGKELFVAAGPDLVRQLVDLGFEVFLDLKFHDIPNTVAGACRAAARLGVWMVNVHASGGLAMMAAAREALSELDSPPLLTAVTVLTSLDSEELAAVGQGGDVAGQVSRLAMLAADAGLDGVVCSGAEAPGLRQERGAGFCLVTPGIRPLWAARNDQSRVLTPAQAVTSGSDYLVIGRPITAADKPAEALARVLDELGW